MIPFTARAAEAEKRLPQFKRLLANCRLCGYLCEVRRLRGELGECHLDGRLHLSSTSLHHGEEPVISGSRGSGTVFLTGCNLNCPFCQNFMFSQLHHGRPVTPAQLAAKMIRLEREGAHNINLVTPSPQIVGIMEALIIAWRQGMSLPIVYNCGGYENVELLGLLDGLVDIYLPDLKYGSDEAGRLSGPEDYFSRASAALLEMKRQVGVLTLDDHGVARQGLIVRHLVLPGGLSDTERALRFIAEELGRDTAVSLMSQYFPTSGVEDHTLLGRPLEAVEYAHAMQAMRRYGLGNGWMQKFRAPLTVRPWRARE